MTTTNKKKRTRKRNRETFDCPCCMETFTIGKAAVCENGHRCACAECYWRDTETRSQMSGGVCGICRGAIHDDDQNEYVMTLQTTNMYNEIPQINLNWNSCEEYVKFSRTNRQINHKIKKYFAENTDKWEELTGMPYYGMMNDFWRKIYRINYHHINEWNKTNGRIFRLKKKEGKDWMEEIKALCWTEGATKVRLHNIMSGQI